MLWNFLNQLKIVIQKRYVNDGIVLEDGKLLFLNTEEVLKKEYFDLQEKFLLMDAPDLFLYGEKGCATSAMERKIRIRSEERRVGKECM